MTKLLLGLGSVLICASSARAQVFAALSGTVSDQSGAAVAAVAVTAKNAETGAEFATQTDSSGYYRFSALPVGEYEIQARKAQFTDALRKGVHLAVGQSAIVNLELKVGASAEQVTVSADAPLVNADPASASGLVGQRQVKDLPLNGRSFDELMTLNPGVVNFTWEKTGGVGVSNSTSGNNFVVSGNRP
ncbi:MAG TPA: carboxypeptidase-like regulatory domain-containing protein [Bryobacteraceae bacterium]|nr:carboxypeptidase-like regulatory domain-containing protein [Bryobacteraceae bacterium]